ncbi:hypothetical protein CK203_085890 [Vitis vinifera]|uniref:Reverse transcriptase domain-containing protein n=1 Tax=Vitis vinifera TaxID=29760 RepID=A0A438DI51_VITVI|nr:hypothetical protein CK203_085890 [Vitis vinifera]
MQESSVCKILDRFLYSNEWELFFPQSLQEVLSRWTSDHWPIVLDINPFKWGLIPFRFENMWLQHPSFKECFSSWWRDFEAMVGKVIALLESSWKVLESRRHKLVPNLGESASRLDSPFSEEEIFNAIFQLDRDKAPGPDGFTIAVFQNFWDVIKEDLTKKISDFRPISLITCLYKPMRIVDEKRRSGEERVVFKIDFEKAYDHVNWDFLVHVLEKKGFSPKWKELDERLSVFDVLSRMMLRAEERSMLEGFKVNLDKSNLIGINLDQNHLSRLALFLDCKAFDWPILYLGLPLRGNPIACGFWDPVIERISRRLDGWQKALTYLWGDFLWSGVGEGKRDHLVSWDVVCKPRVKRGFGVWEDLFKVSRSFREVVVESDGHIVVLEDYCTSLLGFFQVYLVCGRRWGKNSLLGRFVAGDQPLKSQYPRLFRVVMDKNSLISSILGSARPFSWNFSFRRNLSDSEIEDLECLMRSLDSLSQVPDYLLVFLLSLYGILKSLVWLVAHKKLAKMDWVPPRSISDMMSINYKGFDASKRGIVLWQNASIALIWVVWWKEMQVYLRTKLGIQRIYGFRSLPSFSLGLLFRGF